MTTLLIFYKKTDSIKGLCRPVATESNRCWKLGFQETEDSEIDEVVLRIQGIVCNRELPPIRAPFKVYVSTFQQQIAYSSNHLHTDNPTGDLI
jgi:hypothetical protein